MNNTGNETIMTNVNKYVIQEQILCRKWKPFNDKSAIIISKVGVAFILNRREIIDKFFVGRQ